MRSDSHPSQALQQAIEAVGGQSALSRLLGVSQQAVSKWCARGNALPAKHVLAVEEVTGISRHDLNPEIYPRESGDDHTGPVDLEPAR